MVRRYRFHLFGFNVMKCVMNFRIELAYLGLVQVQTLHMQMSPYMHWRCVRVASSSANTCFWTAIEALQYPFLVMKDVIHRSSCYLQ
jgi:hypothetical protein